MRVKTSGDLFLDKPLHQLTGFGVFVAEIDERMLSGEIDLAVHSMKDLPTKRPEELTISAVLKRDSPSDILLTREGSKGGSGGPVGVKGPGGLEGLEGLKEGARVGTSSMRRSAQLLRARPDLHVSSLRGNLQTRLSKLERGDFDAIVLAEAGLQRMGLDLDFVRLDLERFVPSANQGTIIVVSKTGSFAESCTASLDDPVSRMETMIERRILETVGGGCVVPMAVFAKARGDRARVIAEVLSLDGTRFVRIDEELSLGQDGLIEAEEIGQRLMKMGGRELVDEAVNLIGAR